MIEFPCPHCRKTVRTPDSTAGKRGKCPHCGQLTSIPQAIQPSQPAAPADPIIEFVCGGCHKKVRVPLAQAGKKGRCPHCGVVSRIPGGVTSRSRRSQPAAGAGAAAKADAAARNEPKPIEFSCRHCGKLVRTPAEAAGKRGKCPHCQGVVQIPGGEPTTSPTRPGGESKERRASPRRDSPTAHDNKSAQRVGGSAADRTGQPRGEVKPSRQPAPPDELTLADEQDPLTLAPDEPAQSSPQHTAPAAKTPGAVPPDELSLAPDDELGLAPDDETPASSRPDAGPDSRTTDRTEHAKPKTAEVAAGDDDKIQFDCQHCGLLVRTAPQLAGKKGRCPHCGGVVQIPQPAETGDIVDLLPGTGPAAAASGLTPLNSAGLAPRKDATATTDNSLGLAPLGDSSGLTPLGDSSGLTPLGDSSGLKPLGGGSNTNEDLLDDLPALKPIDDKPASSPYDWSGAGAGPATGNPYQSPALASAGAPVSRGKVKSYLVESILLLVCCSGLIALPAIIYASQVNSKLGAGDYRGAVEASSKARTWCIVALCVGLGCNVLVGLLSVVGSLQG